MASYEIALLAVAALLALWLVWRAFTFLRRRATFDATDESLLPRNAKSRHVVVRVTERGSTVVYSGASGAKARDIYTALQGDRETLGLAFWDHGILRSEWPPRAHGKN